MGDGSVSWRSQSTPACCPQAPGPPTAHSWRSRPPLTTSLPTVWALVTVHSPSSGSWHMLFLLLGTLFQFRINLPSLLQCPRLRRASLTTPCPRLVTSSSLLFHCPALTPCQPLFSVSEHNVASSVRLYAPGGQAGSCLSSGHKSERRWLPSVSLPFSLVPALLLPVPQPFTLEVPPRPLCSALSDIPAPIGKLSSQSVALQGSLRLAMGLRLIFWIHRGN